MADGGSNLSDVERKPGRLVSDRDAQAALDWLLESNEPAAEALAAARDAERNLKAVYSTLFKEADGKTVVAKEAEALAHPTYLRAMRRLRDAEQLDANFRNRRKTAEIVIDIWRTSSANVRNIL